MCQLFTQINSNCFCFSAFLISGEIQVIFLVMASTAKPVDQHGAASLQVPNDIYPKPDEDAVESLTIHESQSGYNSERHEMTLRTGQPAAAISKGAQGGQDASLNRVMSLKDLGEDPEYVDCPFCKKRQKTAVSHPSSSQTSLAAAFCCLCCGIITVFIPFLCKWYADTDHTCSGCGQVVAHKPHDGTMEPKRPLAKPEDKYKPSQFQEMAKDERARMEDAN
ncbi:hypothetical protein H2200_002116 [Cladophialophora chaetospira]|uniref:LITAF domain-containing protein n=1 Tax=Cladophialophora chaetospira TaxID=386627 RepID=A0AA38XIA3_9EURO|nr:hypothetical protein H2200_002116 [Cladophialophora chaetospira]